MIAMTVNRRFNGKFLRALRDGMGWSRDRLARELESSSSAIYQWEEEGMQPGATMLGKLARVFGISVDTFLSEVASDKPDTGRTGGEGASTP